MGATRSFEVCSNSPAPIDVFEPITALRIAPCCNPILHARSQKYSTLSACGVIALRRRAQRWTFVTQMKEAKNEIQLNAVEDHDGILTIRGGGAQRNWNGIHYKQGMSAKNVGTRKLSANIATIPPGGVAYAHIHVDFEVILYIIEGKVRHEFGTGLKQVIENEAGDFIYIKPGVPHEVFNMSDTEPVVAFVARSSADEWDNIIPYDRNQTGAR
jgi:uncharacterized RmlC-like cupin family protein